MVRSILGGFPFASSPRHPWDYLGTLCPWARATPEPPAGLLRKAGQFSFPPHLIRFRMRGQKRCPDLPHSWQFGFSFL